MLRTVGVVAGSGAVALVAGRLLGSSTRNAEASRASVRLPAPASPEPPLPAGVEVGVPGVAPFRVPAADFYRIDTALVVPRRPRRGLEAAHPRHGRAARSRSTSATLLALPLVERLRHPDLRLQRGRRRPHRQRDVARVFRSATLLAPGRARTPDADMVLSTSVDGFTAGTPLAALTDGRDALLAIGMNGAAAAARARLPGADGRARPLRLRVGDEVGGRPRGDPVRPSGGLLDAARLVADGPDQDRVADRRAARRVTA